GLIIAKTENLKSQTRLIANLLGDQATGLGAVAVLDEEAARRILRRIDVPPKARVRLYNTNGVLVSDSKSFDNSIETGILAPVLSDNTDDRAGQEAQSKWWIHLQNKIDKAINNLPIYKNHRRSLQRHLESDVRAALSGDIFAGAQYEQDELIVSVALPIKPVQKVLGAIVFETRDVDTILASQRQGLTPIILIAILASILSSLALTLFIALPIRKLARAAEQVLRSTKKGDVIPDLSVRGDEIGDLSLVLRDMTSGLYDRIDDIANFASDVAHEIKNPLTSLRSASETLRIAKTKSQRDKMIDIIQNDVARMARLITDISKASRMDANLARSPSEPLDINMFLKNIADFYMQTRREHGIDILHNTPSAIQFGENHDKLIVHALENPLGQVLRNLIDNALTFSPKDKNASIKLTASRGNNYDEGYAVIWVDDNGPGIAPEDMSEIFERFYTQRPKGAAFGHHSGLGLAICKQIMQAHKGSIEVENRADPSGNVSGARFVLRLPLVLSLSVKNTKARKASKKS
ncbi:MAG: stimulus-sensing domain-containing protein, partial [Robiginitomaculum sp.]|nr:stimulus-sensing domain-containing protein [Robiginitomaculum sp.]